MPALGEPPDHPLATSRRPPHEYEQSFRLLVESVKDYAIFMLDPHGTVVTWNVGAERIKGYRSEEIIGQHVSRFYTEEDKQTRKNELGLRRARDEGRFEDEGWRVRKDGSRFWANVIITPLLDSNHEFVGFAKVTRDLTERRRAEEERVRIGQIARERIEVLTSLSETLAVALTTEEVGRAVADKGLAFAHGDTCTLYLLDEETRTLELVAERGCNPQLLERIRRITPESGNPVHSIAFGHAQAVWIENAEQYDAYYPDLARLKTTGPRACAFWCVPLVAEGRRIGLLAVGFRSPRQFSSEEREFIATFARQCAQALARANRLRAERAAAALAEELRASLATTLRSIGDAVIATDSAGAIVLMNGVAESLTGWSEAEARGRPLPEVFRVVGAQTRAAVRNPVLVVLETGRSVDLPDDSILLSRDGREIPIDDSGAPIRAELGAIGGVVLVFRDVTDRRRAESRRSLLADATATLTESLDYELTVAKVAQLAVPRLADWCAVDLVVEGESRPKRLSVAHVDPAKVALAQTLYEKYPPNPNAQSGVMSVLRTGQPEIWPELPDELLEATCEDAEHLRLARELRLRSAIIVPLKARSRMLGAMTLVFAESGRVYTDEDLRFAEDLARRCANAVENAQLYASEQNARRSADIANRAKDEFLAVVSHELRTPLNAILGWARMLNGARLDEPRRESALETIERNAVTMAQLIDDLLDMSRVISGKMRLEVQQLDLAPIVRSTIESIQPSAQAKGLALTAELDAHVPHMMADPTRLQQVVWNLLSNAVKFTAKGGHVKVSLQQAGGWVELVVADTGKGIAANFLPSVFDAFRQEDRGASRSRGGLGLGLAISRQLVELHGGRIVAQSEGEGRGATFRVTLPISSTDSARGNSPRISRQLRPESGFERPTHLRGLRVLVVDDDDDARRLVATVLEDCGCQVATAQSVAEAMEQLAQARPAVLLSDIGMPNEDGYDLIRKVRALPHDAGGDLPAGALTAYASPEDRRRLLNAGYSIHLPKPVEPAELVAAVATLSRFIRPRAH